jgi:hypothetical protein
VLLATCAHLYGQSEPVDVAPDLTRFSSEQLVACLKDADICGTYESQVTGWPISDELARRGDPSKLLRLYWAERDSRVRDGLEHLAYHFDTPEATEFMGRVLKAHKQDTEDWYWPVNYLAKKCNQQALKFLATGKYRNEGSLQYANSVAQFGKCQYRPAIPYLVTALGDPSLNIVGSAEWSLRILFPDAPVQFISIDEERRYFCQAAWRDGFHPNCK